MSLCQLFEWEKVECNSQVMEHLICDGFLRSYKIWTWHSELIYFPIVFRTEHVVDSTMEEQQEE